MSINDISKNALIGIFALAGAVVGVLIGYKIIADNRVSAEVIGDERVAEQMKLHIQAGDIFPSVLLQSLDGDSSYAKKLLVGKKSAVLFVDTACEPCEDFLKTWNQIVSPKLIKNGQEIIFLDSEIYERNMKVPAYLQDKKIYLMNMGSFRKEYNLTVLPTVVTVDEKGIVHHFHYGRRRGIDHQILKFLTVS